MSRFATSARPASVLEPLLRHRLSLAALLQLQWSARRFLRYDVIVRSLCASALLAGRSDDPACEWYRWMQLERAGSDTFSQFSALVESVKHHGMDHDYPVGISPKGELLDGAHRLACAVAIGAREIAVDVRQSKRPRPYGREWFGQRGCDPEFLRTCDLELERQMAFSGADSFLIVSADVPETPQWLSPSLPPDTQVVSHSTLSFSAAQARTLEAAITRVARHHKGPPDDIPAVITAGAWSVFRLRLHRPRYRRLEKTATSIARATEALGEALTTAVGAHAFRLSYSHQQQREVAAVLEEAGWDYREGTPWH